MKGNVTVKGIFLFIPGWCQIYIFLSFLWNTCVQMHGPRIGRIIVRAPTWNFLTKIAKHTFMGPEYSIKNYPINFLAQCFENSNPNTDLRIPTFYCKAQIRVGAIHILTHIYLCILTFDIFCTHYLSGSRPTLSHSADTANKMYDKQLPGNLIYLQLTESSNGVFLCHRIRTYMFPKERNKNYLLMVKFLPLNMYMFPKERNKNNLLMV